MDPAAILAGVTAAAATGLAGSAHCALMCGPLASAALALAPDGPRLGAAVAWHAGRLVAYTIVGASLGLLGGGLSRALLGPARAALPWVMAAGLLASALELGRALPALPWAARVTAALSRAARGLSPGSRQVLLGAATPFLPCGLIYGVFLSAAAAGGAPGGAAVMLAFALGSTPALALAQGGLRAATSRPWLRLLLGRAVPIAAAAVLVYRAAVDQLGGGPACH